MTRNNVAVMVINVDGVDYVSECPCCNVVPGMTAEIGDLKGTITAVQQLNPNGTVYAFLKKLPVRWVQVSRVLIPCWGRLPMFDDGNKKTAMPASTAANLPKGELLR